MYENFYLTVAAGAFAHTAAGMIWYSPMLFGKFMKNACAKPTDNQQETKNCFSPMMLVYQFGTSLLTVAALYVAIASLLTVQTDRWQGLLRLFSWFFTHELGNVSITSAGKVALFVWAGFNLPLTLSNMIWCHEKSAFDHAMHTGADLFCLLAAAIAIALVA